MIPHNRTVLMMEKHPLRLIVESEIAVAALFARIEAQRRNRCSLQVTMESLLARMSEKIQRPPR